MFFIVLDLRLTRSEYSGTPFFVSWSETSRGTFSDHQHVYGSPSANCCRSWKHKKAREITLLRSHFQWLCSLKELIQSEQQPLKSSSFCKDYPLDFNTSWPHQIEKNRRENGNNFTTSSTLACVFIYDTAWFDANCAAICVKKRGNLRQIRR